MRRQLSPGLTGSRYTPRKRVERFTSDIRHPSAQLQQVNSVSATSAKPQTPFTLAPRSADARTVVKTHRSRSEINVSITVNGLEMDMQRVPESNWRTDLSLSMTTFWDRHSQFDWCWHQQTLHSVPRSSTIVDTL